MIEPIKTYYKPDLLSSSIIFNIWTGDESLSYNSEQNTNTK